MAKECSPLWRTAITTFLGTIDLCENDSTLPVPLSGSNDCANAGVAKAVSTARMVRNFFMSLLLRLRLRIFERVYTQEETAERLGYSLRSLAAASFFVTLF